MFARSEFGLRRKIQIAEGNLLSESPQRAYLSLLTFFGKAKKQRPAQRLNL